MPLRMFRNLRLLTSFLFYINKSKLSFYCLVNTVNKDSHGFYKQISGRKKKCPSNLLPNNLHSASVIAHSLSFDNLKMLYEHKQGFHKIINTKRASLLVHHMRPLCPQECTYLIVLLKKMDIHLYYSQA